MMMMMVPLPLRWRRQPRCVILLISCCLSRAAQPAAAAAALTDGGRESTDGAAVETRGGCCGCCEISGAAFSPCQLQLHLLRMIFPMGCGGSRADAIIEPRYHESWTRETESTWLTNTDVETPLPGANSKILPLYLLMCFDWKFPLLHSK